MEAPSFILNSQSLQIVTIGLTSSEIARQGKLDVEAPQVLPFVADLKPLRFGFVDRSATITVLPPHEESADRSHSKE